MSTKLGTPEDLVSSAQPINGATPSRSLAILVILTFMAEMSAMFVLYYIPTTSYVLKTLLDGFIMVGFLIPGLYFLQLRPLLNQIEERTQAEKRLLHTNELLEKFFSSIDTLIAYMDRDFNFIRVNDTYAKAGEHPPEYFIGKNHFDLYPNEENQAIFQQVLETGEPFHATEKPFEYVEYPERGITYWNWDLQPVKGVDGEMEGLVMSLVDVTGRKRAELQLEDQNRELSELSVAERRQRELAEGLVETTIKLITSLELDQVLASILEQIRRAIPFQGGDIVLIDGKTLSLASSLGFENHPGAVAVEKRTQTLNGCPLIQNVCTSLQPAVIDNVTEFPDWRAGPGLEWVLSYIAVPLVSAGKATGIIELYSEHPAAFSPEAVKQLLAFSAPAALALHNAQSYQAESTARRAAETLSAAALALTKTLDLDQVIDTLLDHIQMIAPSDLLGVTLLEDEDRLVARARRGHGQWTSQNSLPAFPSEGMDSITDSVLRRLSMDRRSLTIPNPMDCSNLENLPNRKHIRCWLVVPIIASDKVIGLVELGRASDEVFSPEHAQWAEALVGQAAVAIQNAWLFEQVRSSSERLQSLAHKLVEIQEKERYYIARELHDEAGQVLSSLKLNLGQLEQDPECPQHVRQRLFTLKGVTDGVLEELHRLAMDLRPAALDHLGLVAALEQYSKNLNVEGLSVQFKALGFEAQRLPRDVETSLYRIVQEALTNIIRHAQASNVGILLEWGQSKVRIFVEDDGIGFEPDKIERKDRLGLLGMRERAEMFGGSLTVESIPDEGTSLIVEVPFVHSYPYRR